MVGIVLSASCAVFLASSDQATRLPKSVPWLGVSYCVAFLFLDGLTSTSQDRLFRGRSIHPFNLMLWVNAISIGFSLVGTCLRCPLSAGRSSFLANGLIISCYFSG
jgi:hypothetical protein